MTQKVIVFGDIHGCYKAAETAISLTEGLNVSAILLGDYVDRGPSSMKVLEALINAKEKHPDWVFLRGNHDQMLLDLINGNKHPEGYDETTEQESYQEWQMQPKDFQNKVVAFIESTQFYFQTLQYSFVHAPLRDNGIAIADKTENELIWNYDLAPHWLAGKFIHGHLTTEDISETGLGTNINTLCGYGGKLTGLVVDIEIGTVINSFSISEDGRIL